MAQWHGRVLAPATVLFLACASDPVLPVEGPFRVGSSTAWAGGTVDIISRTFAGWDHTGVLRLGATDIPLVRVDDSTMRATLPDTLVGAFSPAVVRGNTLHQIPALTVHGYSGYLTVPLYFNLAGIVWPTGAYPGVIGFGASNGTARMSFVMFDMVSGTWRTNDYLTPVNPSSLGPRGPGPTIDSDVFAFHTQGGKVERWNLRGTPSLVAVHEESPPYTTSFSTSAWLGGDRWLRLTKGGLEFRSYNPSTVRFLPSPNQASYLQMSPTHDLVLAVGGRYGAPIGMIDVATGAVAYELPLEDMRPIRTAAFTSDGSLLALAGSASTPQNAGKVRVLDARTGTVIWDTTISVPVKAVAVDPVFPLVYVVALAGASFTWPIVLVFDRSNGRLRATMAPSPTAPPCDSPSELGVAAVSGDRRLHFLCEGSRAMASGLYRFTLP